MLKTKKKTYYSLLKLSSYYTCNKTSTKIEDYKIVKTI